MFFKKIVFGSECHGFHLKEALKEKAQSNGVPVDDMNPDHDPHLSFSDVVTQCMPKILEDSETLGFLICGSAQGIAILANRYPGIRAVFSESVEAAEEARKKFDANVLIISGPHCSASNAMKMGQTFMRTPFNHEKYGGAIKDKINEFDSHKKG